MSDPYGCSTGRHFYPEKCTCVSIGFEDGRHHLQHTELEALRAENARLTEHIKHSPHNQDVLLLQRDQLRVDVEILTKELHSIDSTLGNRFAFDECKTREDKILKAIREAGAADKLRAEVERLTKERDEAQAKAQLIHDGAWCVTCEGVALCDEDGCCSGCGVDIPAAHGYVHVTAVAALTARVQELEGLLRSPGFPHRTGSWACQCSWCLAVRAALESGTGQKSTNEGLKCPPGESAAGAAHISNHGGQQGHGGGVVGSVQTETVAQRTTGAGTGEQVGREPSPMPEAPAPKTFTVEEIERALGHASIHADEHLADWLIAFRRALGLGEP